MSLSPLPIIPEPTPTLTDQVKAGFLKTVFQEASLAKFAPYLILHEFSADDFSATVGAAMGSPDTDVLFQRYYQWSDPAQLIVRSISSMETQALPVFSGRGQSYQVFISLDKIDYHGAPAQLLVPYQLAKLLSGAFIHGLVTRLILDKYKDTWATATPPVPLWADLPLTAAPPKGPNPHPIPQAMDAGAWADKYLLSLCTQLLIPKTWTNTSATLSANHLPSDYFGCLHYISDCSLQTAGIVIGWLAGDAITASAFGNGPACQRAIWSLLKDRHGPVAFGKMVGYTFTYLNGFISSERTKAAISANSVQAPLNDPIKGPALIYGNLASHVSGSAQVNLTPLATAFFNFIVAEYFAISDDRGKAAKYQAFIQGFAQGTLGAADILFRQLFNEAYELGYTNGFRDGYAQGYSAGWTEGYAVGYQAGQNTWMSGLQGIIDGASGLLNNPDDLGKLLNNLTTVGTVIATLF
ncbi:hypothetical protein ACVII1_006306 [Bradyrhizobium elkanii]